MNYKEIKGDLIELTKQGEFDVVTHGCNCFCTMGAGIAPKMAKSFYCNTFDMEHIEYMGDIKKLGNIDYNPYSYDKDNKLKRIYHQNKFHNKIIYIVNSYTQYYYGKNHSDGVEKPLDYEALTLCLRKINTIFTGKHIGLPKIGCGLAGGDWNIVKEIIKKELKDCKVTVVIYE